MMEMKFGTALDLSNMLDRAAALKPGEGIEIEFASTADLRRFRTRLYMHRAREQKRLKKRDALTGWEDLSMLERGENPRTLWIGVPDARVFGISDIREGQPLVR